MIGELWMAADHLVAALVVPTVEVISGMADLSIPCTAATKEHALELELHEMMSKWDDICFETTNYRDSTTKILGSVEVIEANLGKWSRGFFCLCD